MGNPSAGWSLERRKQQSEAIKRWKPWSRSTGPKSRDGKATVSGNAWAGGDRPKLRQAIKELKAVMRQQQNLLASLKT